jgi:hypothetical protein
MNKTEHWQKIIDNCKASGLTQKTFCQNHNIKIHTFHYWLKKLSEKPMDDGKFISFSPSRPDADINIQIGHVQITLNINEIGPLLLELDQAGLLYDPA